jgi:hypothetical protein
VRQTAPWIAFIVYGLDKLGAEFERSTTRLLRFRLPTDATWYVAAYSHRLHGIVFTQSKANGPLVRSFTCIGDARSFYDNPAPPRPQHVRLAA